MGEREETERDFERVFGKVQRSSDQNASNSESNYGATQKLPGDSDLLGIRTDSDRFIFKNPIPERLPITPPASAKTSSEGSSPEKGGDAPTLDAMTIALNVNVFANIPKPGEERKPVDLSSLAWSEATQLFVRKPAAPAADAPSFTLPANKDAQGSDIFKSLLQPAPGIADPVPIAKFTRVMHVQDSVTLPQSSLLPQPKDPLPPVTPIAEPSNNPAAAPVEAGPSDFTRIVKGSELRALQEKFAFSETQGAAVQGVVPTQNASPSLPAGMATQIWSASSGQTQLPAMQNSQHWPTQPTSLPTLPKKPERPAAEPSKLSQYLPLILVLNLLFLLAILLIVFFAVKK